MARVELQWCEMEKIGGGREIVAEWVPHGRSCRVDRGNAYEQIHAVR